MHAGARFLAAIGGLARGVAGKIAEHDGAALRLLAPLALSDLIVAGDGSDGSGEQQSQRQRPRFNRCGHSRLFLEQSPRIAPGSRISSVAFASQILLNLDDVSKGHHRKEDTSEESAKLHSLGAFKLKHWRSRWHRRNKRPCQQRRNSLRR